MPFFVRRLQAKAPAWPATGPCEVAQGLAGPCAKGAGPRGI
jgi:hypothetical protein